MWILKMHCLFVQILFVILQPQCCPDNTTMLDVPNKFFLAYEGLQNFWFSQAVHKVRIDNDQIEGHISALEKPMHIQVINQQNGLFLKTSGLSEYKFAQM